MAKSKAQAAPEAPVTQGRHPQPKKARGTRQRSTPRDVRLFVEVLQHGVPQLVRSWRFSSLLKRRVVMGNEANCALSLPFAGMPHAIPLFEIGRGHASVLLDPRLEGFVSTGSTFGDVREFISPRGAIAELATIGNPLSVALKPGSRGRLALHGFDVIFKVELGKAARVPAKIAGAGKGIFAFPTADSPLERWSIGIALATGVVFFVPFLLWLFRAPWYGTQGLAGLSPQTSLQLIHPSHFQLLPRVYRENFDTKNPIPQVITWVSELQKRWKAQERGETYESPLEILGSFSRNRLPQGVLERWKKDVGDLYETLEQRRRDKSSPWAFRVQKDFPTLLVPVSGGLQGSLELRKQRRIASIIDTQKALLSLIRTEHEFLGSYLNESGLTIKGLFDAPARKDAKPEDLNLAADFFTERERYLVAERYASAAAALQARKARLRNVSEGGLPTIQRAERPRSIWLSSQSSLTPYFLQGLRGDKEGTLTTLMTNVAFAADPKLAPAPPPPKPRINMEDVDLFIFGRREEVKACYDAALRREAGLAGVVTWRWSLDELGRAGAITALKSNIKDKGLLTCIRSRIAAWRFPKPKNGPVVITYPFRFVVGRNEQSKR